MLTRVGVVRVAAGSPPGGFVSSDPAADTGGMLSPSRPLLPHLGLGGAPVELPPFLKAIRPWDTVLTMPRNPVANMDIATDWLFGSKCRRLQREYPNAWGWYWCAYLALLGETWRSMNRSITLRESYPATVTAPLDEASAALQAVGLLDEEDRIPEETWNDRVDPALTRIVRRREAGAIGGLASQSRRNDGRNDRANDGRANRPTLPYKSNQSKSTDRSTNETDDQELPQTIMGFRPKASRPDPEGSAGLWGGRGTHDGRHGETCAVCAPLAAEYVKQHGIE